jgi:hypothetical protein
MISVDFSFGHLKRMRFLDPEYVFFDLPFPSPSVVPFDSCLHREGFVSYLQQDKVRSYIGPRENEIPLQHRTVSFSKLGEFCMQ